MMDPRIWTVEERTALKIVIDQTDGKSADYEMFCSLIPNTKRGLKGFRDQYYVARKQLTTTPKNKRVATSAPSVFSEEMPQMPISSHHSNNNAILKCVQYALRKLAVEGSGTAAKLFHSTTQRSRDIAIQMMHHLHENNIVEKNGRTYVALPGTGDAANKRTMLDSILFGKVEVPVEAEIEIPSVEPLLSDDINQVNPIDAIANMLVALHLKIDAIDKKFDERIPADTLNVLYDISEDTIKTLNTLEKTVDILDTLLGGDSKKGDSHETK